MRDASTQEVFDRDQRKAKPDEGCIDDGKLGESKQELIRDRGEGRRTGRFKIKAAKDCKYSELALAGKWIVAGRLWLEDNTPCETVYAIEQIAKFLPYTTRHGRRAIDRMYIARDAIYRAYGTSDLDEQLPKLLPSGRRGKSVIRMMLNEILNNGPAKPADFVNATFVSARLCQLVKQGDIKRQNGIYFADGQDVSTYQKRPRTIKVNDEAI
jgi:hypothetical protein